VRQVDYLPEFYDIIVHLLVIIKIWTDYKTNTQTAKELKITPTLDKLRE
jgi:hypothetical protein